MSDRDTVLLKQGTPRFRVEPVGMSIAGRVVTFGEVMLRLSPPGYLRLLQTTTLEVTFGGAEVNVAVALAQWGVPVSFVTRLPADNDIAQACLNQVRGWGVAVDDVLRGGDRMGTYFVERGASQRGPTVLYDRAASAIAEIDPASLDWGQILEGAGVFHFTGITPALSEGAAQATLDGAKAARERGLFVTCDLNYRSKLWSRTEAGAAMTELLPYVDLCLASEEDAATMFDIHSRDDYAEMSRQLIARFPNICGVARTGRISHSASRNGWSGTLIWDGVAYDSRSYEIEIVERIGSGDVFTAGLIDGFRSGKSPQETVEFAVAASCLKHSIPGDFSCITRAEVDGLIEGDGAGRVRR